MPWRQVATPHDDGGRGGSEDVATDNPKVKV